MPDLTASPCRILVADGADERRAAFAALLRQRGYDPIEAADGPTALARLCQGDVHAALVDAALPGLGGPEMVRAAGRLASRVPVILYVDDSTFKVALDAVPERDLAQVLERALARGSPPANGPAALERSLHAQKMEALGRLAGGVAHDFNNLLAVVLGYSELLLNNLPPNSPCRELVEEIRKTSDRGAALTRQLLAFSRRQVCNPVVLDLNAVLANMDQLLQRLIGRTLTLVTQLDPALPPILADPGQVEQVVMNLALNARDAMPQGGRLTLKTAVVTLDEPPTARQEPRLPAASPSVPPGRYVLLAVCDTGHGMTDEVKAHLFEPFFTTKEPGKGTGLGLATVYGIMEQAGGHIAVDSAPGQGTTVRLYWPPAAAPAVAPKPPSHSPVLPGGSETILIVEDEDAIRSFTRLVLQRSGYTVLEARDGEEALAVAGRHDGPIHLIATDVVMPQLSGPDLIRQITARRPTAKVLYLSGYTKSMVLQQNMLNAGTSLLQKPFTAESLLRKVREVLDA